MSTTIYGDINAEQLLSPTPVQTAAYTAAPGDLVAADISSGGFTVKLPNAPANGTRVAVKVINTSLAHQYLLTVATQGSDVLNKSGGGTSFTLVLLNQGAVFQYYAAGAIWYLTTDDLPLSGVKQLIPDWFNVAAYGAIQGATDSSAAFAAALAAACAVGGTMYVPASATGWTCNATLTPTANKPFTIAGDSSAASIITFTTSTPAISFAGNTGAQRVEFRNIQFVQNGSGDCVAIGTSSGNRLPQLQCYDAGFITGSSNTGGSPVNAQGPASSNAIADSKFRRCFFGTLSSTRTVPALNLTCQVAGGMSNCTWDDCDFNPSDASQPCVYLSATTGASDNGYHMSMVFRDCRFEQPTGGAIQSMSGRGLVVENCTFWDLGLTGGRTLTNSLIYIGSNSSQYVSAGTRIVGCTRYIGGTPANGPNGTSTWDVYLDANTAQTLIEGFTTVSNFHNTSAPAYINANGCPSLTILNPQSSGATDSATYQITNPPVVLTQPDLQPPVSQWAPSDEGYAAWAFDPNFAQSGANRSPVAGVLQLIGLQLRTYKTVGDVELWVTSAGSALSNCYTGLYNSSGTLIAASTDQSASWQSTGWKTGIALTVQAGQSLSLAPGKYWIGILIGSGSTTPPAIATPASSNNFSQQAGGSRLAATAARYGTYGTGQTALPSALTLSSIALGQIAWWAALY